jgi:hypothetical protein
VIGLVPTHSVLSGGLSASVVVFVSVGLGSVELAHRHASVEATVNNNMSTTVQVLPSGSVVVFVSVPRPGEFLSKRQPAATVCKLPGSARSSLHPTR